MAEKDSMHARCWGCLSKDHSIGEEHRKLEICRALCPKYVPSACIISLVEKNLIVAGQDV
ncbi:hypothetical protein CpipJ_CPIJ000498 [Culex quinquefasciatus]|uniref:Uncharacterized protein n=1 Tax=Culex quinquefasciatus TaxID=7176 RepID=B0W0D4_CULQU|nr:hypothetical protein CpipJ_CPIJ000498 [Culex quinquefasciatus]|eukprot:XP_001842168.1 hypothetical protein CpipJ_CPIJ000498 [Culex quinquefasciatus]